MAWDGKLVRPDTSLPHGQLPVEIKIFSPEPSRCLLWAENQIAELKDGAFALEIGHATNQDDLCKADGAPIILIQLSMVLSPMRDKS